MAKVEWYHYSRIDAVYYERSENFSGVISVKMNYNDDDGLDGANHLEMHGLESSTTGELLRVTGDDNSHERVDLAWFSADQISFTVENGVITVGYHFGDIDPFITLKGIDAINLPNESTNVVDFSGYDRPLEIWAGFYHDTITLTDYGDTVHGGGNTIAYGGAGDDTFYLHGGVATGGQGNDVFHLADGINNVYGDEGNDVFVLSGGRNSSFGGSGDDSFFASGGTNTISGGSGADTFHLSGGVNTLIGGTGADTYHVSGGQNVIKDFDASQGDTIRLDATALGMSSFEDIKISEDAGSYVLTVNGQTILEMWNAPAFDALTNISLEYRLTEGTNMVSGGGSGDEFTVSGGTNTISGGDGADVVVINGGDNTVFGDGGADTVLVRAGTNSVSGGAGDDVFFFAGGTNTVAGGAGTDTFHFIGGDNTITDFDVSSDAIVINKASYGIDGVDDLVLGWEKVEGGSVQLSLYETTNNTRIVSFEDSAVTIDDLNLTFTEDMAF